MDTVPLWIWLWLGGEVSIGALFLCLRSIKRGSVLKSTPHPGRGPDMQVEVDYMNRFPESRFDN